MKGRTLFGCIALFFVALIIILGIAYRMQQDNIYYPEREHVWTPNHHKHNSLMLDVKDGDRLLGEIHLWYFENNKKAPTILYCHGSSGNISQYQVLADLCRKATLNLCLFDYRGYGKSSNCTIGARSMVQDACVAYDYVLKRVGTHTKITVMGMSLGGYTASYLARYRGAARLALFSTFSSMSDVIMASKQAPAYFRPMEPFLKMNLNNFFDDMPNSNILKGVTCPTRIIHSPDDEIVPYGCALKNKKSLMTSDKKIIDISGGHASPVFTRESLYELLEFCAIDYKILGDCNDYCIKDPRGVFTIL